MNNQKDNQEAPQNSVPPPYPYFIPSQDDEISLHDMWKVLVDQKKVIFLFSAIATITALVYALLVTPIYRAEALLAPVAKEKGGGLSALAGQFGGLASLAGINLGNEGGDAEEAIAILKSRVFTNKFIEDEQLMPILFEDSWDAENNKWKHSIDKPSTWRAYHLFDSIRSISVDKNTGFITLAIDWKDPVLAAQWVNKLVARANILLRQKAILNSEKSINYLEAELLKTSVIEIKESIYSLIEAQTKNKMVASTQEEYAFRVLDKAVVPEEKFKPKRTSIVLLGFLLGGLLGVFLAFIRRSAKTIK